jgi:hypothetical protein
MADIQEFRASERGWRRSCGDRGIHRAGENARRVGESSRGNWYVRVEGYADTVSLVKMREFRRNYLHHGSSKTFVFGTGRRIRQRPTQIDVREAQLKEGFWHYDKTSGLFLRESQLHFNKGGNKMATTKQPTNQLRCGNIKATI